MEHFRCIIRLGHGTRSDRAVESVWHSRTGIQAYPEATKPAWSGPEPIQPNGRKFYYRFDAHDMWFMMTVMMCNGLMCT